MYSWAVAMDSKEKTSSGGRPHMVVHCDCLECKVLRMYTDDRERIFIPWKRRCPHPIIIPKNCYVLGVYDLTAKVDKCLAEHGLKPEDDIPTHGYGAPIVQCYNCASRQLRLNTALMYAEKMDQPFLFNGSCRSCCPLAIRYPTCGARIGYGIDEDNSSVNPTSFEEDRLVVVHGLQVATNWNNQLGRLCSYDRKKGRFVVRMLRNDDTIMIKPKNLYNVKTK